MAPVLGFENREKKSPANKPILRMSRRTRATTIRSSARRHIHRDDGQAKVVEAKAPVCYICVMKRDEAISLLQQHEAELKRLGVEHLYMFGSTARGEAKDDSDVDLFFDYEKGKLGLFELMDVKEYAAGILGRKADIMTRDSLHKVLREKIESTAVRVF